MTRNENTLLINAKGQMAFRKNIKGDPRFIAKHEMDTNNKLVKTGLKFGMSYDSPFHSSFTEVHPATKQLLDYAYNSLQPKDPKAHFPHRELSQESLKRLPIECQEEIVEK